MSAARELQYRLFVDNDDHEVFEITGASEAEQYLNPDCYGWFSLLSGGKGGRPNQKSWLLRDLVQVVDLATADQTQNHWISQAVFNKRNRRRVNLLHVGQCFVDLDYYTVAKLEGLPADAVVDLVLARCEESNFPPPSIIVNSGRGLQLKWLHEPLPAAALPRWDRTQQELVALFRDLGGDPNARDASRVLRLAGTFNQKNQARAGVIYYTRQQGLSDAPERHTFDDLANALLPFTREQLEQMRGQKAQNKTHKTSKVQAERTALVYQAHNLFGIRRLNWARYMDLKQVVEMRGGMPDGQRELAAFWICNHLALSTYQNKAANLHQEMLATCRWIAPHWSNARINNITSDLLAKHKQTLAGETVKFKGREYPTLYTPKNSLLIDAFEITDAEQRELSTIISTPEKRRRKAVTRGQTFHGSVEAYQAHRDEAKLDKQAMAIQLKAEGKSVSAIAAELSVSRVTVYGYLKASDAV